MSNTELADYTKGITARDMYTEACGQLAFFTEQREIARHFGHFSLAVSMQQRVQEWVSIADSLRPQHYEGPNN